MILSPPVALVSVTAALGAYMGMRYLRGFRNPPLLIGTHLLLGLGAVETLLYAQHVDSAALPQPGSRGITVLFVLAAALMIGLLTPIVFRKSARAGNVALAAHAATASVGVALVWFYARG